MEPKSVLIIVMDVTPSWWGLCETEDMSLPQCTEAILGFSNLHLMFSPMNELVIIGVTPESAEIMWPASQSLLKPNTDMQRDGQYDLLGFMNDYVRRQISRRIASSESSGTSVRLASGIAKGLCYYVRRCRDLQPTKRYDEELNIVSGVEALDIADKVSARMLVVRAGEDSPSQYLALMNAVFTAQKLRVCIDVCVLPLAPSTDPSLPRDANFSSKHIKYSSLLQQAAELTGGIYLHIPNTRGLLQYLLSVFLPAPTLRPKLLLPDLRSSGFNTGVDFRAACFCHRRLIDIGYVCSVCLSVFCEFSPLCATCGSPFAVPNVQK
ncbi:hypothetical protein CRM22_003022 [Opisthorchis felineus]|uniref:General transcription factor IIH subunit 3 n=1 Tax=Opisthorchis felineus TaxID=147828 RepID=A0A4S2M3T6_OPIFE|nr:hypothetical protein CRM22_003022 [Opisthorchis felineus]